MTKWTTADHEYFKAIAQMRQPVLLRSMRNFLKKYYNNKDIKATKHYILCKGDIPIMLVAHMDTVFKAPPQNIYYDNQQSVMWSPQGLGADDRAGVFLILKIIKSGLKPHICLTTDEEIGGIGAGTLVKENPACPFDCKYIIELDRQGYNDCVFYTCGNTKFTDFIESYGFITDWGTYSDISDICPAWKIAGVNLSVGYFNEHREIETLNTKILLDTFNKVCKMLQEVQTAPFFEYIANPRAAYSWINTYYSSFPYALDNVNYQCSKCHKVYGEDDIFPVKARKTGKTKYYCLNCVSAGINWCKRCGEAFETESDTDDFCPDCINIKQE